MKFSSEFIAALYKEARNREEADKGTYTVVDVRMWEPHLIDPYLIDEEELPAEVKAFRAFLIVATKTDETLILLGNYQPEQEICIEDPDGKQIWRRASRFELVSKSRGY